MTDKTRLIVLAAFDRNDEGNLIAAFEPREMPDEGRAKGMARELSGRHVGVVAWVRTADLKLGDYGPPETLAVYGDIPDME